MNSRVRRKWVDALRSGEYKQGVGALSEIKDDGTCTHCVLGVLCDLWAKETNGLVRITDASLNHKNNATVRSFNYEVFDLPPAVMEWADLHSHNPILMYNGDPLPISELNDRDHLTFGEIAKLIEENLGP